MTLPRRPPASPALRVEQLSLKLSRHAEAPTDPGPDQPAGLPPAFNEQRFQPAGRRASAGTTAGHEDPVDSVSQVPRHD